MKMIIKFFKNLFKKKESKPAPIPQEDKPKVETPAPIPVPPQSGRRQIPSFEFVDSSHHHPYFDVKKYIAPILSNKCTQGVSMVDVTHATRKKLCAENGIKYSGYHFYECKQDPIKQADHYLKSHGPFVLPPQVDFETYKTKTREQTEADLIADKEDLYKMLCYLEEKTGMTPWLYLNYSAAKRMKFDKKFARFPAWFARYNEVLGPIPFPWTRETTGAWQFTDNGPFPGFDKGNDVNIYFGDSNVLNL